jgi:hypothetical protein
VRPSRSTLLSVVAAVRGEAAADRIGAVVDVHPALDGVHDPVPRRVVAQALNLVLFDDLLERVPDAAAYVVARHAEDGRVTLDHGAVRTVAWPATGDLPPGEEQVTRILRPLGYELRETYPLTRLRMTGRSYAHADLPEHVGQWFVSELHPDDMSAAFRSAVESVLATSRDPLDGPAVALLDRIAAERTLPAADAADLVRTLVTCFARQHDDPLVTDYDVLLGESAEMAWIATEGTSFNHATDRVADVHATALAEQRSGRPVKDTVEVSASGRIRQTALRATPVTRTMRTAEGDRLERVVPGSFFEFISRDPLPDGSGLDLAFDAANATGIFGMTRTGADADADAAAQRE